ncbi:hypothetical protein N7491_006037 [Penicillium cf. griseofulvum]|nr:hypothetical protein N7491_006037 [Penicillium cf. griseofulvum]
MLVAIISTFLSTLGQQTIGRIFPISINPISNYFYRRTVMGDSRNDWASCSRLPPLSTTERTTFGTGPGGCVVYGYPSTGGVLVKKADLLGMLFYRSPALMSRSALLVSTKKTDSVISCDGLVPSGGRVGRIGWKCG